MLFIVAQVVGQWGVAAKVNFPLVKLTRPRVFNRPASIVATCHPRRRSMHRSLGDGGGKTDFDGWRLPKRYRPTIPKARYTSGNSDVISVPAGFRRHLVGKTLINVFHCNITEIRFVGKLMIIRTFS